MGDSEEEDFKQLVEDLDILGELRPNDELLKKARAKHPEEDPFDEEYQEILEIAAQTMLTDPKENENTMLNDYRAGRKQKISALKLPKSILPVKEKLDTGKKSG